MFEMAHEHEAFRASVGDFAEKKIAPHVAQWATEHHFPGNGNSTSATHGTLIARSLGLPVE